MSRNKNQPRLVVIDRDGTLNTWREGFTRTPEEFEPVPGALEAVALLNRAGWLVVMATNQPGLGRGVLDMTTFHAINTRMHQELAVAGGRLDAVFFCPHGPEDNCRCAKPQPGLLLDIAKRYGVEPKQIPMVGDALRDMQAAASAGFQPHLVCTGEGRVWRDRALDASFPPNTQVHSDLLAFAEDLLAKEERNSEKMREEADKKAKIGAESV
ncbi:MAG: D-glycero-beta-D-manno-heptose 1,7-bisphosphate 7-phosphatase [Brachymonas sp.]|nr:D-glycero-beta-D-manno-heptose 1,7-bisphosphate 7-phosphatase [Brachymonas sp.]